jgi:cysteinyl-tRNA synthetase
MREDTDALGLAEPDVEPRATEHIDAIIDLIQKLLDKRHAYVGAGGDVFFDIRSYPDYGRLSGKQLEELRAGARVEIQEDKRDPLDFVLWKSAKPGEPSWDSPWGPGRPGWHIECSAMSMRWLGEHFDIHGGGRDLQFPHHENEIAQSVCATGRPFVNVWMHNGFVRVADEKMSKSLGNFFTVREVLQHYRSEEVRYFILSSHYRSPVNYTDENLHSARASLTRLYTALRGMDTGSESPDADFTGRFYAAMDDDFNTPEACAVLFDIAHAINREPRKETPRARSLGATLRQLGGVLGLLQEDPENYLKLAPTLAGADLSVIEIEQLITQRTAARKRHDWQESDRIRNHLARHGVILEDGPAGTTWRRA